MKYVYDLTGMDVPVVREFETYPDTVIPLGQVVTMDENGKVVGYYEATVTDVLGVTAEAHLGVANLLNPRDNENKIKVFCSPTAVFDAGCKWNITATAGTTSTITSNELQTIPNGGLAGGTIILVKKAETSLLTAPLGTAYTILANNGTAKTVTADFGKAVSAGDQFLVLPPFGYHSFHVDTSATGVNWLDQSGNAMKVVETDKEKQKTFIRFQRHLMTKVD